MGRKDRRGSEDLPALDKRITALAFSLDAATLLVGGTGPIHRVSLPEGKKVGELAGHKVVVSCLRLTPDRKLLASTEETASSGCGPIKDGKLLGRIELPVKGVYGLAISPDGRYLANVAAHGKMRVWER